MHPKRVLFQGAGMGKLCSWYNIRGLRSLIPFAPDALSCTDGSALGGIELGLFPADDGATGSASSRVRAEAGRGGKEKLPSQQSTSSPAPRGRESTTCCRLVFPGGLGTSSDF